MIKFYIINLKHKVHNKNEMLGKLASLNIPFEFVDAIYGRELTSEYLETNGIHINEKFRNPFTNTTITMGEIGCSLSHHKAWTMAHRDGIKYPIILEDDVDFLKDFENIIKTILKVSPKFDILYLSRKLIGEDGGIHSVLPSGHKLVNAGFSYWNNSYMLTHESVKKLLNSNFLRELIVVDEFIPMLYTKTNSEYLSFDNYTIDDFVGLAVEPQISRPKPDTFLSSETEGQPYYVIQYEDNFYENQIQIVTVGTDPVDGYKRFVESANAYSFPFVCLGFGEPWGGNDMTRGPGGGHKVVLFKKYLDQFDDDDERLILFSDCYDAVVSGSPDQVLSKFNNIRENTGCDVMFSAEALLWPDESIADQFPDVGTPYKYLNSGGFIGSIKSLKKLTVQSIESSDDDQYYYQMEYLKSWRGESDLNIILDDFAYIFQTLSSHFDQIKIDYDQSKVINELTDSRPLIIHGNGGRDSKQFLNHLCNYINLKYRDVYGYKDTHSDLKKLEKLNYHEYPTICVIIWIDDVNYIHNIKNLYDQKYPRSQIEFIIATNSEIVDVICDPKITKYDYVFIGRTKHVITDRHLFEKLLCSNLDIVSPMLSDEIKEKGYWNVPKISGSVLIHSKKIKKIQKSFLEKEKEKLKSFDEELSDIISSKYDFMYMVNFNKYGYIQ